eukprot:6139315-Prymnesium_polylepis.2
MPGHRLGTARLAHEARGGGDADQCEVGEPGAHGPEALEVVDAELGDLVGAEEDREHSARHDHAHAAHHAAADWLLGDKARKEQVGDKLRSGRREARRSDVEGPIMGQLATDS